MLLACGCGADSDTVSAQRRVLHTLSEGHDVQPFDGWSVHGLQLYVVQRRGPNPTGRRWVVGIDERSGELVQSASLMERLPSLHADVLALRALSILIERHGVSPLRSDSPRDPAVEAVDWNLIAAPRSDGEELVFWALVERFEPTLTEYRVDLHDWSVDWSEASEVRTAQGEVQARGPSHCEPVARCGCFVGCERVQPITDTRAARRRPQHLFRALDHLGQRLLRDSCDEGPCWRVCRSVQPGTVCLGALIPEEPEECTESCPESTAPFHCETSADSCRRIDHREPHREPGTDPGQSPSQ